MSSESSPHPAATDEGFISRFARFAQHGDPFLFWLAIGVTGVLTIILVAIPLVYRELFDHAIPDHDREYLIQLFTILGGLFLVQIVGWTMRARALGRLDALMEAALRSRMLRALRVSGQPSSPEVTALFTNHLGSVGNYLKVAGPRALRGFLQTVLSLGMLFVVDWRLALITVGALPIAVVAPKLTSGRAQRAAQASRADERSLFACLQDILDLQRVIDVFGLGGFWDERFEKRNKALEERVTAVSTWSLFTQAVTQLGASLVQIIVLIAGSSMVFSGWMSVGSLIGFFALLFNIVLGVTLISESAPAMLQADESSARIDELLALDRGRVEDEESHAEAPPVAQAIRFDGVDVRYDGAPKLTLDGVDLSFRRGDKVALVGPSGSGKSTVLNVLLGFTPIEKGSVLWDEVDTQGLTMSSMRSHMSAVFQDTTLFNLSIRDNIRMGKLDATEEEIVQAAKSAEIHETIVAKPDGYDTEVGPGGSRLSGGQRQRIALARAFVRSPQILVLDEATSALDPRSEAAINETVERSSQDRTVISVTHRLQGVRDYDAIIVLEDGHVAEQGRHDELLARGGLYATLCERQDGLHVSEDGRSASVDPSWLRRLPTFAGVEDELLEEMARRFVVENRQPGENIVVQGEAGNRFYVIARGTVSVRIRDPETGEDVEVGGMFDGDYFGEISLLADVPRSATVQAVQPTTLLSLSKSDFAYLGERLPPELQTAVRAQAQARLDKHAGVLPEFSGTVGLDKQTATRLSQAISVPDVPAE